MSIVVCDKKKLDEGTSGSSDIKACNEDIGSDIIACPDEECSGTPVPLSLNLSGGFAIDTGDFASGAGGTAPYSYEISCGTIDAVTGEIDIDGAGCCGTGQITVTDFCGAEASFDVAFPDGEWVFDPDADNVFTGPRFIVNDTTHVETEAFASGCIRSTHQFVITATYQQVETVLCYTEDAPLGFSYVTPRVPSEYWFCVDAPDCFEPYTSPHQERKFFRKWVCT